MIAFFSLLLLFAAGAAEENECEDPALKIETFVAEHELLGHKYLKRFSQLAYENEEKFIRDFATQHYVYSRHFQVYLRNVMSKVTDEHSKHLIGENIEEESGRYEDDDLQLMGRNGVDPSTFAGVPHPKLMKRFVLESGADPDFNGGAARKFTDIMINATENGSACVGLAVMAFAIESTVSHLYQFIWEGLMKSSMKKESYVFFPLHILIDDGHADALKEAWRRSLPDHPGCEQQSYDVTKLILDARVDWYDSMDADQTLKVNIASEIEEMVANHGLLHHKYLARFSNMEYDDPTATIRDFATQHYVYSRNFQVYLKNVLAKVTGEASMTLIGENIEEESGRYGDEDLELLGKHGVEPTWFNRVPHPKLMKRFVEGAGADPDFNGNPARAFTDLMIKHTAEGEACVGLAIMAFAIESTVSQLYQFIWEGLKKSSMDPKTYVFFPLHILIDDGHAAALIEAWKLHVANNPEYCLKASYDVVKEILDARSVWYDHMDEVRTRSATQETEIRAAKARTIAMMDPGYSNLEKMALSARIMAWQGQGNTLSGQITCRDILPNGKLGIWVQKYGLGVEELVPNDFILVDENLNVVQGSEDSFPNYATRFHVHVYRKRPEMNCIIHSHPMHVSALAMTGSRLMPEHMDFMAFYEEVQHLEEWPGVPFGDLEGELISGLLGDKYWSGLLANHGLIVGGRNIEEAMYRAYFFERAAEAQLKAMAANGGRPLKSVKKELGDQARDWRMSEGPVLAHFRYWSRLVLQDAQTRNEVLGRVRGR